SCTRRTALSPSPLTDTRIEPPATRRHRITRRTTSSRLSWVQPPRSEEPVAGDVGHARHAADVTRPQGQGCGRERAPQGSLRADADAPGGAADHRGGLVQVLSEPRVEGGMVPRRADWGVDVVASRNFVTPRRVS